MLVDIVLDTNVLMHAENSQEARCEQSGNLLQALKICTTKLCVDEGFDLNESRNRSQIGSEYLKHLRPGAVGFELVAYLARTLRIKYVPRRVPQIASKAYQDAGSNGG
jgi:hypothetical protein